MRLSRLKDAYANAGMLAEAGNLQKRIEKLNLLIEQRETADGVFLNAAKYDAIRYRYQLADTEKALKINHWIIALMALIGLVAIGSNLYTSGLFLPLRAKPQENMPKE